MGGSEVGCCQRSSIVARWFAQTFDVAGARGVSASAARWAAWPISASCPRGRAYCRAAARGGEPKRAIQQSDADDEANPRSGSDSLSFSDDGQNGRIGQFHAASCPWCQRCVADRLAATTEQLPEQSDGASDPPGEWAATAVERPTDFTDAPPGSVALPKAEPFRVGSQSSQEFRARCLRLIACQQRLISRRLFGSPHVSPHWRRRHY
mmetsp:Transcript_24812/g.60177  ORF Transcript_24812/g.60177 Transcript_24812/m.60177 type:complete len:208 (+) Transcript_24812:480-1103(+)